MHRNNLLTMLEHYAPMSQTENHAKVVMSDFIKSHIDCFQRSCVSGHITASAWLVNRHNTHAFLIHHRKLDRWLQPGGHCDGDSDVRAVAIREAQEESGIRDILVLDQDIFDIDIHEIPKNDRDHAHLHFDIRFLLHVVGDEKVVLNEESLGHRWVKKNEYDQFSGTSIGRMFQKWIARDF